MTSMKAHVDRALAREPREVADLVVVLATHDDAVELDRSEIRGDRRIDAAQHAVEPGPPGDALETILAQRIERDVHAAQSGREQRRQLLLEQHGVGRKRDVVDAVDRIDAGDEAVQVAAHERLTTGDADRPHADRRGGVHDLDDLFVAEQFIAAQPVETRFGHAVDAAQIALVGDRDAQIGNRPVEGIGQWVARQVDRRDHLID